VLFCPALSFAHSPGPLPIDPVGRGGAISRKYFAKYASFLSSTPTLWDRGNEQISHRLLINVL
jgi:hypothetical protein